MSLEEEFAAMRVVLRRRSGDTRIQRQVGMSLLGFYYVRWSRVEVVAKIRGIWFVNDSSRTQYLPVLVSIFYMLEDGSIV